jgi:hypothetical protein
MSRQYASLTKILVIDSILEGLVVYWGSPTGASLFYELFSGVV